MRSMKFPQHEVYFQLVVVELLAVSIMFHL